MNDNTQQDQSQKSMGHDLSQFTKFTSCISLIGLFASVMAVLFLLVRGRTWSWEKVIYSFSPFICSCIFYLFVAFYMKEKYHFTISFIHQKLKYIFILLIVIFLSLNLTFWKLNQKVDYINVDIENLSSVECELVKTEKSEKYFVLYSSENCIYCYKMEDIYQKAFRKSRNMKVLYVDLSNEMTDNIHVKERAIKSLPLLVCYQNGEEVARIEGYVSYEKLTTFLNEQGG